MLARVKDVQCAGRLPITRRALQSPEPGIALRVANDLSWEMGEVGDLASTGSSAHEAVE